MIQRNFSTGIPKLDNFVGGLLPGDSFLNFVSDVKHHQKMVESVIKHSNQTGIPIVYLSVEDQYLNLVKSNVRLKYYQFSRSKGKVNAQLNSVKRFVSKNLQRSYLILDDLSIWIELLGSQQRVVEMLTYLTSLVLRKNSLLICSALRSAFDISNLIRFKEEASICLDLILFQDQLFYIPLALKDRYVAHGIVPFRIDAADLVKPIQQSDDGPVVTIPPVSEKQARRFDTLLSLYDERYEKMFRAANEAMILFDIAGDYREINTKASELLGYSYDEIKIVNPISLIPHAKRFTVLRFLCALGKQKKGSIAVDVIMKNGKSLPIEFTASGIGGGIYFGFIKDKSTDNRLEIIRKQKEEENNRLIENLPFPVVVLFENKPLFVNNAFLNCFRYHSVDEIKSKSFKQFLIPESYRQYLKHVKDDKVSRGSDAIPMQCVRKDGTTFQSQITIAEIIYQGKNCLQISLVDISVQKDTIDKLTASEKKFKSLIEYSICSVAIIRGGVYDFVNKAFLDMFGYESIEAVVGKDVSIITDEAERERLDQMLNKHNSKGLKQTVFKFIGKKTDGKKLNCELLLVTVRDDRSSELLGFFTDITEIYQKNTELRQRHEEMDLLNTIMPVFSSSMDLNKLIHSALNRIMETLSWGMGAVYLSIEKDKQLQLIHHRNIPSVINMKLSSLSLEEGIGGYLSKTLLPQSFYIEKYPSYLPFRSIMRDAKFKKLCLIPLVSHEKLIGMILLASKHEDDAARYSSELFTIIGNTLGNGIANAKAFQEIIETEKQKHEIIQSSPDILYTATPTGSFAFISSGIEQLIGYPPKEYYRNNSLWLKLIHPDDKKIFLERITNLQNIDRQTTSQYRILPKGKASYRWIRDTITPIKNNDGIVTSIMGTISDITEEKQLLDYLKKENVFKTDILSSIREGVVVFDCALKCMKWNKAMEMIVGLKEQDVIGKHALEVLPHSKEQNIDQLLRHALEGKMVSSEDLPFTISATNEQGFITGKYYPLRAESGEIHGVVGVISDISQRKTIENEIREFEHILSNVIDTMGDILILTDLQGRVLQVNRAFLHNLGYSRKETNGCEFPYPWLLDEEMGRFVLWIANLREHTWLHDFDMTLRTKDGRLIPASLSTTLLRNQVGEPIAMLNIARDITERKRLMKDLESRNKQIEIINRVITTANQTLDFRDIFDTLVKEINDIVACDDINVGLLSEDGKSLDIYAAYGRRSVVEGKGINIEETISRFSIKERKPIIVSDFLAEEKFKKLLPYKEGLRSQISLPISLKGKTFGTLNLGSEEPYVYTDEHTSILLPIAQQIGAIIDRALLFKQVSEDSAYIHNLLDSIDSVVYTVDRQIRIREVNKAWYEFLKEFGVSVAREYNGKLLYDVLPSEPLKAIYQNVVDQLLDGTVRIFSQEFIQQTSEGERTFQLVINPMVIDRKITGLVFTHTDISAIKKTEADLKKSNEQLLALNEISVLISSSLDLQKMLISAVPLLKKIIEATGVIIYLQEHGGNDLVLAHQLGFDAGEYSSITRLKQSTSATGEVVTKKRSLYIHEKAYLDERIIPENREVLRRFQIEAMAVIPLVSKDKVFGALDIFYSNPHEFSEQERQILTLVGNQLGAAIENTQLYGELRSQVERLTVLYNLSQQLTSTLDLDQIFQSVYDHVKQIIPFQNFKIDLYDEKTRTRTPVFHVETVNGEEVFVSKISQPTIISHGSPEENVIVTKRSYQSSEGRAIFVPMLSKETLIGIMSVEADEDILYTETHLRLLESIGNLSAIALEKGKLYEETLQKSIEIQRRNKELDDFTYVVSHDLKEPLISVEGFSRILQVDYSEIIQAEGKEYLDSIVGATSRMKGLIDDLLLLSRVSRPSESFRNVSVKDIVNEITIDMEFTIRKKGVNFIIPTELPIVYGNETQLKIVFRNLISNAIKFNNKPGPTVEIAFQNTENNYYLFSIKDNGIGIDKEFHEKIFVIFQRLHRREEYEGTGAGLAIVKKIIELHNGKIWVESEFGKGSTFFFTVPKPLAQEL